MLKRKQHHPKFKAKVVLEAQQGEETVKDLHANTGQLAVTDDSLARKLQPWSAKWGVR